MGMGFLCFVFLLLECLWLQRAPLFLLSRGNNWIRNRFYSTWAEEVDGGGGWIRQRKDDIFIISIRTRRMADWISISFLQIPCSHLTSCLARAPRMLSSWQKSCWCWTPCDDWRPRRRFSTVTWRGEWGSMIGLGTSVVVDVRIKDLRRSLIINLGLGRLGWWGCAIHGYLGRVHMYTWRTRKGWLVWVDQNVV